MLQKNPASTKLRKGGGVGDAPGPRFPSVLHGTDITMQTIKDPTLEVVDMS